MASGDTVFEKTSMQPNANELSYTRTSTYPDDDGGFATELVGTVVIDDYSYALSVDVAKRPAGGVGSPTPLGAPLLDPSKTYDVIIKEH